MKRENGLRRTITAIADRSERMDSQMLAALGSRRAKDSELLVERHMVGSREYVSCASMSQEAIEKNASEFRKRHAQGYRTMSFMRNPVIKGRLLDVADFRYPCYVSALGLVDSGTSMAMMVNDQVWFEEGLRKLEVPRVHIRDPGVIVLDLSCILEHAVQRVSLFRHKHVGEYPRILAGPEEEDSVMLERIGYICSAKTVAECKKAMDRLVDSVKPGHGVLWGGELGVKYAYMTVKWDDRIVQSVFAQDDVEHLIALCNFIARSAMITAVSIHATYQNMKPGVTNGLGRTDENAAIVLGKVAEMAYGSPFLRLADMTRRLIVEGDESREKGFKWGGLAPILFKIISKECYEHGDNDMNRMHLRSEDDWREGVVPIIEEMSWELGFSFHSVPRIMETIERIRETEFVTRENLPVIAAAWQDFPEGPSLFVGV
jgi:hypothetical protein